MNSRLLLAPALALVAITLASCGSKTTSPAAGGSGGLPTGPSFNFAFPATGTSQSFAFADTGSWIYHCAAHGSQTGGMRGTVVVSATATADSGTVVVGVNPGGTDALVFTPATVTIKPGGHVRWINGSAMTDHSVTRP